MIDWSSMSPEITWVHDGALHTEWSVLFRIDEIEQCVCAKLTVLAQNKQFPKVAPSRGDSTSIELHSSVECVRFHTGWLFSVLENLCAQYFLATASLISHVLSVDAH